MISPHRLSCAVLGMFVATAAASAQTQTSPPEHMWTHGSTLNVFGGAATASGDRAAAGGGAFGWELTPRVALEGSGTWLDWGSASHAFTTAITAQVALPIKRPFVPFLAGGVGLYHASFNRSNESMPEFYRRRVGPSFDIGSTASFTDPSLAGGGGINVFLGRHWAIRPEVMATVVVRDSRTFVVTTGAMHLAYHFEDHTVTPLAHPADQR